MFSIVHGTKFDFIGRAPLFAMISLITFALALLVIGFVGIQWGLDFSGGHQILLRFEQPVHADQVRAKLHELFPTVDTSVQSYSVPTEADKTFFLTRIQRSETLSAEQVKALEDAFKQNYGDKLTKLAYNPEEGDVIELQFVQGATKAADLSEAKLKSITEATGHEVNHLRTIGKLDPPVFRIVLRGVDAKVVAAMKTLDPAASAPNVEFVGPTVGKQLRNDGILAVAFALLAMLIYIALRFDFYFAPGAVICLFHDAILTIGLLAVVGQEFSLATIAGVLTLVGYSINDTIIVFDRIRETAGKAKGTALKDVLNRAINETLARTIMTSVTVLTSSLCLMFFGRGTVLFELGLIMTFGVITGTYSSIYVAAPIFKYLRDRFDTPDRSHGKPAPARP
jgi:preprotein translocase subunit SecF